VHRFSMHKSFQVYCYIKKSTNSCFGSCSLLWKCFTWRYLRKFYMGTELAIYTSYNFFSKCAAWQFQHLGRCRSFESEIPGKRWKLWTYFKETPFNKLKFCWFPSNPESKGFVMMYSKIPLSFRETVPKKKKWHLFNSTIMGEDIHIFQIFF